MIKYLQLPTCKLAEFASDVAISFTVSGFLLNDGVTPVSPADIGDICYATLEPKTPREELISFTIVSVTAQGVATITATRGLLQKFPYTVGGASFDHQNGSDLVISNNPGLFNQLTAKDNPEVITEQWSFPAPTGVSSPVTKAYADALVINGGADATNLTRGIVLLSESPTVAIGTATITIATPGVVSFVGHGLVAGDTVKFTTTGALPTGLVTGTSYYVIATDLTANTFKVAAVIGGAAINTTGGQSGVHTLTKWTPVAVGYNDTTKLPSLLEKAAMAGGGDFGTPSVSNKFITQESIPSLFGGFGDGADGDVEISGTVTLVRDMYYNNLIITDVLITNGYSVYVKGTISGAGTVKHSTPSAGAGGAGVPTAGSGGGSGSSSGIIPLFVNIWSGTFTIEAIGGAGGAGGSGGFGINVGGAGGTALGSGPFKGVAGKTGASGVNGSSPGLSGTAGDASINSIGSNGVAGGTGGSAGDYSSPIPGGIAGIATAPSVGITLYRFLATSLFGVDSTGLLKRVNSSAGSGSGASGSTDTSPSSSGGGGGGGGGNGGFAVIVYKKKTWTGSSNFAGGAGGAGGASGGGSGSSAGGSGANGASGSLIELDWYELV